MRLLESSVLFFVLLMFFFLTSCAENLPKDIPRTYSAPKEYTFTVSYDKAWRGVVRAISDGNRIITLDKGSGLIVTEYLTINKEILTMFQTALFGRTYKNSYSLNLYEEGPGRTNIRVRSNLMMEQFALYNRERRVPWFEAYMRQDLFGKICGYLYNDIQRCERLFPRFQDSAGVAEFQEPEYSSVGVVSSGVTTGSVALSRKLIMEAQTALSDAGYNPGMADGIMGRRTRSAVEHFQSDQGLYTTGELDQQTLFALGIAER